MKKLMLMLLMSGMVVQGNFVLSNNDDEFGEDVPANIEDVVEEAAAAPAEAPVVIDTAIEPAAAQVVPAAAVDLHPIVAALNAALVASILGNGVASAHPIAATFFADSPELLEGPDALLYAVRRDFAAAAGAIARRSPGLIDQADVEGNSPGGEASTFGRARITAVFRSIAR